MGEYIRIICTNQTIVALKALKDIYEDLPKEKFIRVHKSYVVSLDYIKHFNFKEIELNSNKNAIPIGRKYKDEFRVFMTSNSGIPIEHFA